MDDQYYITVAVIIGITVYPCFYIWKWIYEYCRNQRNRHRLAQEDLQIEPPMEMRPPSSQDGSITPPIEMQPPSLQGGPGVIPASEMWPPSSQVDAGRIPANDMWPPSFYEHAGITPAIPVSSDLATRRIGSENLGQDNTAYVNDDTRFNQEAPGGNDGNNTENRGPRRTNSDTDVVFYLGQISSNVIFCSRNKRDNKSYVDCSSVESNNGTDTVDDGSDSKYETASSGSTGGRNSRAPSPWLDF